MADSLTQKEEVILRAFQRQVDRLRKSSIVQCGGVTFKYSTKILFPTGEVETDFQGYDKVAFQSQLPILRQFFMDGEAVFFHKIRNILYRCCDRPDLQEWIAYAKQRWQDTCARFPVEDVRYFQGIQCTIEEAVKNLFYGYGGLFHVDLDKPNEEEEVQEVQEAMLHHAFPFWWNCLNNLDSVIHIWLDEPTKPVPAIPTK